MAKEFVVVLRVRAEGRKLTGDDQAWSYAPKTIEAILKARIESRKPRWDYDLDVTETIALHEVSN